MAEIWAEIWDSQNMIDFDRCPICNCNNAPLVWTGKRFICEDCYEKKIKRRSRNEGVHRKGKKGTD